MNYVESSTHKSLKNNANEMLRNMGFKDNEIFHEHRVKIDGKVIIPDVVGIREGFRVAIECGNLNTVGRLRQLKRRFHQVFHLGMV